MKKITFFSILLIFSCEDSLDQTQSSNLVFVASEGTYGDSDGSIAVFSGNEKIQTVDAVGDVVQSLLVDGNNLFVIVNNSHLIKRYSITEAGLSLPGIEIETDNSSPREMVVVDDKLYFTNWNSRDVKVLDLITFSVSSTISIDGTPEDIVTDGDFLWVSIPQLELYDGNNGSSVVKIDLDSEEVIEIYDVGRGPEHMLIQDNTLWISRTFYASDWSSTYYGSSKLDLISGEVTSINYGLGLVCGGNVLKLNNEVYRTVNGGVAPLDAALDLNISGKIGSYQNLYSASSMSDNLYLGTSDYFAPDTVNIHNNLGELKSTLVVGVLPGDFATWVSD
tara:strand:+ start:281 stop:1285 length:1005 start_codon:yes stop_codon:yes gene_type:complete